MRAQALLIRYPDNADFPYDRLRDALQAVITEHVAGADVSYDTLPDYGMPAIVYPNEAADGWAELFSERFAGWNGHFVLNDGTTVLGKVVGGKRDEEEPDGYPVALYQLIDEEGNVIVDKPVQTVDGQGNVISEEHGPVTVHKLRCDEFTAFVIY